MKYILAILAVLATAVSSQSQDGKPKANEEAIVLAGNARFTVLTPELIRMEYSEKGQFEDQASFVVINRELPVPSFTKKSRSGWLEISTDKLKLRYKEGSGAFDENNLQVTLELNGEDVTWKPGLLDGQNLKGTARTLDGCKGGLTWDGKPVDLGQGLVSQSGWALLDDSKSFLFDNSDWKWVENRSDTSNQDWYFFGHGHDYKKAMYDYTQIAGKIPMVPKYALGYWWSRYWVYSDQELKDLMHDFKSFDIPIDVLIIDMDWHETFGGLRDSQNPQMDETGHWLGWTGYSWNKALFPDPPKFLKWTNDYGLKTALNLHPASGIAPMEDQYAAFAESYDFDTTGSHYIHYQMADKKWAETYFNVVLRPMEKQGVDFWWLDWQQYPTSKVVEGLSNTWWLNYTFFTDMQRNTKQRPLLFHRWGGMGNHRYQIGFSGDDKIDWGSLKYQTYFTSTASNVGYGYWSHDIGGHASSEFDSDPELYVRWLQFGVFSPILRTHSAKISSIERRFWKYPNHFGMMKGLVHLRYSLAPYIYNAARIAHDQGISICRPMYYDYPDNQEAYEYKYQYMFGDDILVAPISDPMNAEYQLASTSIWLPEGKWYERHSGTLLEGGKVIERKFALDEIPLYVKAGSIIPKYPKIENLQSDISDWVLSIMPGGTDQMEIYEDDGNSDDYRQGAFAITSVETKELSPTKFQIAIEPRQGNYKGMKDERSYTIRLLRTFPAAKVVVNGKEYSRKENPEKGSWRYEGKSLATVITLPEYSAKEPLKITVEYHEKDIENEQVLNGKLSRFRRLSKVMKDMKIEVARTNWWAYMPDVVLAVEQTPVSIQYTPEKTVELLKAFDENFPKVKQELMAHPDGRVEVVQKLVDHLEIK